MVLDSESRKQPAESLPPLPAGDCCNLLTTGSAERISQTDVCSTEGSCLLQTLPAAPRELVTELARRYILLYEMITGEEFQIPNLEEEPLASMKASVQASLQV